MQVLPSSECCPLDLPAASKTSQRHRVISSHLITRLSFPEKKPCQEHALSELYVKLPPTLSYEEQGEDQQWHSTQPPIPIFGERSQPVSLALVKLILSPVQETSREGDSQLLSELTKLWRWHCWLLPPAPRHPGWMGHLCVGGRAAA